jgi:hypothetical protein
MNPRRILSLDELPSLVSVILDVDWKFSIEMMAFLGAHQQMKRLRLKLRMWRQAGDVDVFCNPGEQWLHSKGNFALLTRSCSIDE